MGERARQVFQEHAGASKYCFDAIAKLLAENTAPPSQLVAHK
jgi:hypothetical protein